MKSIKKITYNKTEKATKIVIEFSDKSKQTPDSETAGVSDSEIVIDINLHDDKNPRIQIRHKSAPEAGGKEDDVAGPEAPGAIKKSITRDIRRAAAKSPRKKTRQK